MIAFNFQHCYRYSSAHNAWNQLHTTEVTSDTLELPSISVSSFNVLFMARTGKRFPRIISDLIPQTNADILVLMEVTGDFIDQLTSSAFVRDNYYISHTQRIDANKLFEVIILSKLPFATVFMRDNTGGRYQHSFFNFSKNPSQNFIVSSAHLWAYEERYLEREKQFKIIDECFKTQPFLQATDMIPDSIASQARIAVKLNNIILLGDLNIHMRHEDKYIYENGFIDLWRELYPDDAGYTWDPSSNSMIRSIFPLDNRRMRLDRILIRKACSLFKPQAMQILAKESLGFYLNYSDHFMIQVQLMVNSIPTPYEMQYDTNRIVTKASTGFRTINQTIALRVIIGVVLVIGVALLIMCVI